MTRVLARHRRLVTAALVVVAAMLAGVLTGCSGVPRSSVPQPVRTLVDGGNPTPELTVRPEPGDDPRKTVDKFLQANVSKDERHPTARTFLTAAAAGKWQDGAATVVDDYRIGVPADNRVEVTGRVVGTLTASGVYSPTLTGSGRTSEHDFVFQLTQVDGQWRISDPPAGLLIRRSDFESAYRRRPLYFFNSKESRLVPDLRYSAAEQQSLASWLLAALIAGPQQSVLRNEFPDQLEAERAKVTLSDPDLNDPVKIQLPGLSQVEPAVAERVAAQIAYTFYSFQAAQPITMFDGPNPVRLGGSLPEQFTRDTFASVSPESSATPVLYYLRNGALMGPTGAAVPGPVGTGKPGLRWVAVTGTSPGLDVVGVGLASATVLTKGTPSAPLRPVALPAAATTRPEFRPGDTDEVWLGAGTKLLQAVGTRVRTVQVVAATPPAGSASVPANPTGRRLSAVRFSPDGTQIALVYATATTSSVWVGAVGSDTARVDGIHQITPQDWRVTDVAWSDSQSVRAIGKLISTDDIEIWSCYADGSSPQAPSAAGLPGIPDAVAAGSGVSTVVSAAGTVWREQPGGGWQDAFAPEKSIGTAPIFAG